MLAIENNLQSLVLLVKAKLVSVASNSNAGHHAPNRFENLNPIELPGRLGTPRN